jgi:hypothetical protein
MPRQQPGIGGIEPKILDNAAWIAPELGYFRVRSFQFGDRFTMPRPQACAQLGPVLHNGSGLDIAVFVMGHY